MFSEERIKSFRDHKTPFFFYDLDVLKRTVESIREESSKYGYHVHYALKANANVPLLEIIKEHGLGADCVSGNEVKRALEVGFDSSKIVFAGVGKSDEEINLALDAGIFCFNVESFQELEVINELAGEKGVKTSVAFRINPNVDAKTHKYITTGLEENKFGINMWEMDDVLELVKTLENVEFIGIHFHIGSQITDLNSFRELCLRVNEIQQWFYSRQIIVQHVNVGGGLGVDYENPDENLIADFKTYFALFNEIIELRPNQQLHFELGRVVTAQCGTLISKALYVKKGIKTNFAILDAGMTELIRPALYQAYHKIENLTSNGEADRYDVVGPICESSDCFGKAMELKEVRRGDLIALRTAGAYGQIMASDYNLRDRAEAIYSE